VLPEIGRIASFAAERTARRCLASQIGQSLERAAWNREAPRWREGLSPPFNRMFLFAPRPSMRGDGSKKERVAMAPSEILKALSQGHERWPGDALEAASSQRSKVSSLLLENLAQAVAEVERFEAAGFPKPRLKRFLKAPSPLFYGVFLLADWREKAAYRPFARLMRFPWVAHDNLLEEPAIEESGYRIIASLFDGDPQFVFDIILDVGADPSVRFWQWHALTLIGLEGNLDRTVADFAQQAFGNLSPDEKPLIWAGTGADRARAPCSEGS